MLYNTVRLIAVDVGGHKIIRYEKDKIFSQFAGTNDEYCLILTCSGISK